MNIRSFDLCDLTDEKTIVVEQSQEIKLITPESIESFLKPSYNLLTVKVYSTQGGKYHYVMHAKDFSPAANYGFLLLGHFVTKNGGRLNVYQNSKNAGTLSVFDPPDGAVVMIHPLSKLELIFTEVSKNCTASTVCDNDCIPLRMIRREYLPADYKIVRNTNDDFSIRRWKYDTSQKHFFFKIPPEYIARLAKRPAGKIAGPKIIVEEHGKPAKVVNVDFCFSEKYKEEVIKQAYGYTNKFFKLYSEGTCYGTKAGLFYGALIVNENTKNIQVLDQNNVQVIEIEIPYKGMRWHVRSIPSASTYFSFSLENLEDHVINDHVFQRFLIRSNHRKTVFESIANLGSIEFSLNNFSFKTPVLLTSSLSNDTALSSMFPGINNNFTGKIINETKESVSKSKKKHRIYEIDLEEIDCSLKKDVLLVSSLNSIINATDFKSDKVTFEDLEDSSTIIARPDQQITFKFKCVKDFIWHLIMRPHFLDGQVTIIRKNFYEHFEVKINESKISGNEKSQFVFALSQKGVDAERRKINIELTNLKNT